MRIEEIRKWLKKYKETDIYFTRKAEIRCNQRRIDKETVKNNLLSPKNLIHKIEEGEAGENEYKFRIAFKISNARTLVIRLTLNERIKIITVYEILNKIQKGMWLRWKK